jgi:hypothetical protein
LGTATVALVASGIAVGAMVANMSSYGNALGQGAKVPAMAVGGIVREPTFALVGEAGPEIVMPLSQYEAKRAETEKNSQRTSNDLRYVTYLTFEQHIHGDIVSPADEDRVAQKAVDKVDEELYRRRNS